MNLENTNRLRDGDGTYGCLQGRSGGKDSKEFGMNRYTLCYLKWMKQGPAVQHRELWSMPCGSLDGRGVWGEWMHAYVWLSPFAVHLRLSQHGLLISYSSTQNKKVKNK